MVPVQVVLRHAPQDFRNFEVRHLAVDGEAWTAQGTEVRARFLPSEKLEENICSAVLRV